MVVEEVRNMMCDHTEILTSSEITLTSRHLSRLARINHPRQMERLQDPRRSRVEVDSPTKLIGRIRDTNMDLAIPDTWCRLDQVGVLYPTFDRGVYTSSVLQDFFQQHQRNI